MNQEYIVKIENIVTGERITKRIKEDELEKNILEACGVSEQTEFEDVFITDRNISSLEIFPYVIVDGRIQWNVSYHNVTVRQFIETYIIADNTINIKTGYPAASGVDLKTIVDIWDWFYDNVLPIIVTISAAKDLYDILRRIFECIRLKKKNIQNGNITPDNIIDAIYRKDKWNYIELSVELQIDKDRAKNLLKGLGYLWDNSSKLYTLPKDIKQENISNIKKWISQSKYRIDYKN